MVLCRFRVVEQGDDFRAILDLSAAAIRNQKLDQRVYAGQIGRVMDFALMACRCQEAGVFEN